MSTSGEIVRGRFGTAPVFLTSISTILGAIMFLRFGYAVGHVGFMGVLAIILLGHAVTIPTAMAIAEIATNQKVEGGGVYYIISRSFGLTAGGAIGIGLFFSQAISVAFYVIAFAEALNPLIDIANEHFQIVISDKRLITIPAMIALTVIMLMKGANIGVKILYAVVGILFLSLLLFFLGDKVPSEAGPSVYDQLTRTVAVPDNFFYVFAICFPAFTGMAAGVGLSGDLHNPKRSIPMGTLAATFAGMVIYVAIAYMLAVSATPDQLDQDQLIMSQIAVWGPIIPIGLAAATLSSALGSIIVAPRTLQAIGHDGLLPSKGVNAWLAREPQGSVEPFNAVMVTSVIGIAFVVIGDVNIVAEIISMFFMVTYGSICLISFLEHFAADPSYRPTFMSRWYFSLFGAIACLWLMFKMNPLYALVALIIMAGTYLMISYYNPEKRGLSAIMQGVIFQLSRKLQLFLQGAHHDRSVVNWRPSLVCVSKDSFSRQSAFDLIRWLSHHYGFGTYIHFIEGYLSKETGVQAQESLDRLIRMAGVCKGRVFVDTLVSPSMTTAICQVIQLPGISGHDNNGIMFEFSKREPEAIDRIIPDLSLIPTVEFDLYILASSDRKFGYRREIHIWLTPRDYENASLMILTGYILLGDPEWKRGFVKIFATYPEQQLDAEEDKLRALIQAGRIPISPHNINMMPLPEGHSIKDTINQYSQEADLIIRGMRMELLKRIGKDVFLGYDKVGDILFVNTHYEKKIASDAEVVEAAALVEKPVAEDKPDSRAPEE